MPDPIHVAVAGAAGRMGTTVCEAIEAAAGLELSGRADPSLSSDLGDVLDAADVVVDFTVPDQALPNAHKCLHAGVSVVVGTTGFDLEKLRKCATDHWNGGEGARAFVAPNFAIGAVLMMEVGARGAEVMPEVEIVELHHDGKLDRQTLTIRHDSIDRSSFMPGVVLACRRVGSLPDPLTVGLENLLS